MKYVGSKRLIVKHILPIMLKHRTDETWVEPFVGGGNVISEVTGNRIGADSNPWVVALMSIRDSLAELPKNEQEFTEADYERLKNDDSYPHKGYAGFAFSFGGKWLGGWRRDHKKFRDSVAGSFKTATKQSEKLKGVSLINCCYRELEIPPRSIVYCDPPYKGVLRYGGKRFDSDSFFQWAREKTKEGHKVFVSEYEAPADFSCVWAKEITANLSEHKRGKKAVEKLFVYDPPQISRFRQIMGLFDE